MNCPICHDELTDSRVLPCTHSFCLKCLQRLCKNKLPGDDVPCPMCNNEFQIPKNGVAGLIAKTHNKEAEPSAVYEACLSQQRVVPPTVYCVDCSQKQLCERCSITHQKWKGRPHDVRTLDTVSPEHQSDGNYCDKHKERVKIYCLECLTSMCSMCCLESHRTHKFEQIDTMMDEFARSIDDEVKPVTKHIESFCGAAAQLDAEKSHLFSTMQAIEHEIKDKGEEMKQSLPYLIDIHVSELLHKLRSVKSTAETEVKSQADAVQLALTEMESFRTTSLELKSTVSPADINQTASDVRDRAKELLQKHVIPGEHYAPSYTFTPVNIDEFLRDNRNFIGQVTKVDDRGTIYS